MDRDVCAVCNKDIVFLYTKNHTPITFSQTKSDYNTDIYTDQHIYACNNCGCVQLKNLIDPLILYNTAHNSTYNTPTWREHHNMFADFILDNSNKSSILEIGGASGILYNILKDKAPPLDYSCMDLCDPAPEIAPIFTKGNCETFEFNNTETIVMSHIFEHLYNPSIFVKNISNHNVNTIFISIPNMTSLLEAGSPSIINNEHTYYLDKNILTWLFATNGYKLSQFYEFKNHSLFFMFQKSDESTYSIDNRKDVAKKMLRINTLLEVRFNSYKIPAHSFFVPAGHLGQLFYTQTKPSQILGFLDNDPLKQGYRVYGTPYDAYSFDKLREYVNDPIHIYVYGGPYTEELVRQIKSLHSTAIIHTV